MKKTTMAITAIFAGILLTGCASENKIHRGEMDAKKEINCAYAEGDIRALQSEKTTVSEQMATGITTIVPVGLVLDTVQGKTGTNASVAIGDYNDMLDKKIAEIKKTCGL